MGNLTDFDAHKINTEIVGDGGALIIEAVLTAMLVIVVSATAVAKDGYGIMAPLAVGLTIAMIHFVAVPITGASVNPARTFAPALILQRLRLLLGVSRGPGHRRGRRWAALPLRGA